MIGYDFSIHFNDSYAFRDRPAIDEDAPWYEIHQTVLPNFSGQERPGVRRCAACHNLLAKWDEPLIGLRIKKRKMDLSCTYDGITVASRRFREVCEREGLTGLQFTPLPDDPEFFSILPTTEVAYDTERRGTQFQHWCPACKRFRWVTIATPVMLKPGQQIPDLGFVRSDVEFASDDEKHPLILCGEGAGRVLKAAKLRGLVLTKFEY